MDTTRQLAERCEQATAPDEALDEAIRAALGLERICLGFGIGMVPTDEDYGAAPFTASIDAAMTLIPEGWRFAGSETTRGDFYAHLITRELTNDGAKAHSEAHGDTLALAISAAALRAHGAVNMVARIASGTLPPENTEECSRAKPSGPTAESGDAQPTPVSDPISNKGR